ncbi:MAG: GNAT family N-acetyltransferase [Acidobacteriota bacterium]
MALDYRRLWTDDQLLPSILMLVTDERRRHDSLLNSGRTAFYEARLARGHVWGAFDHDTLIAFGLLSVSPPDPPPAWARALPDGPCGFFRGTLVHPAHRRRGIGTALLRQRIAHAEDAGLSRLIGTVNPRNIDSINLLIKHGFTVLDHLDAYADGKPRLVMGLTVGNTLHRPPSGAHRTA